MNLEKLETILQAQKQPKFRLEQIKKAIFQDGISSWDGITTLSKDLRQQMSQLEILSFEVQQIFVSKDGQSVKALLKLADGNLMETVLIAPKLGTWSACISSQVGCAVGCKFCATGKMGLIRNLTAEEITDQILFWRQYLRRELSPHKGDLAPNISTIVYMGMGEPFLNWKEVSESLRNLIDEKMFGFGARSISVSTSGIPEGIDKLATEFPQVNLALSLHFADDAKRSSAMPINQKNNLEKLRGALQKYFAKTKRKVFLEYVMLSGVNDSSEDAEKLIRFVKSIGKLQLLHVNLIRYNSTNSDFKSSSKERTVMFRDYLEKNRIGVTIRKSLGEEIQGACGQLAGK
jgi:23S rRNA (adenine(2503)-C(2))-methyltransferase